MKENFRLLDRGRSHQHIRDEIFASVRSDRCPYCNFSTPDSLDHVLPQKTYPEFTVLAQNLAPACSRCNRKKGQNCFRSSGLELMHPYYVRIPDAPILFADVVIVDQGVTWEFYLRQSADISDAEFESILNLFQLLDLADLYYRISVGEITDRLFEIDETFQIGGAIELEKYLNGAANSACKIWGENYWKTAILRALAGSNDFCHGGYNYMYVQPNGH